jgi:hypothetical protein
LVGGFTYTIPLQHSSLVKDGLVEVNPAVTDPNGKGIGTRATQAGIELVQEYEASATNEPTDTPEGWDAPTDAPTPIPAKTGKFVIEDAVPMPKIKRVGGGNSLYPFDALEVGQSFFVGKEAKSLASTVANANLRYAEVIPGETRINRKGVEVPKTTQTRKFEVRAVDGGARIWRTA